MTEDVELWKATAELAERVSDTLTLLDGVSGQVVALAKIVLDVHQRLQKIEDELNG